MPNVVIAGSINMDVVVRTDRQPRAGETVAGRDVNFIPGGKGANQAVAASRLGAKTIMVGKLGVDSFGDTLANFLEAEGIDVSRVHRSGAAATGTALIVVDANAENSIVVVPGTNGLLTPDDVKDLSISSGDVLASQFEIPSETIEAFFVRGRNAKSTNVLNPAPARHCSPELLDLVDVLVVNETELAFFVDKQVSELHSADAVLAAARELRRSSEQIVVVTLGSEGAIALLPDNDLVIRGRQVVAVDTTGAGDCFVGALCSRLGSGGDIREGLEFANLAASVCVQRLGAGISMPRIDEVAGTPSGV